MKEKKEEEKDELSNKTVFSITHDEIKRTGVTQCVHHEWRISDERNLQCIKCPSAIMVEDAETFLLS